MAPFFQAVTVRLASQSGQVTVYTGDIDKEWLVGSVPNGGYLLALIIEACLQYQSTSTHRDPIHVTAHFLRSSSVEPYEIRVHAVKSGKGFTNLVAKLVQKGETKVTTHLIFGTNARSPTQRTRLSIDPPSPYARQIPLYVHPSKSTPSSMRDVFRFEDQVKTTTDPVIAAKNRIDSPTRTTNSTVGGGGLEWAGWLEFMDKGEKITSPSLAFLVDIFVNTPRLLPRAMKGNLGASWFPTMVLSIEFRSPIPPPSAVHADRTVGIYSLGRFLNDPDHRHDSYVEVWTAPSNIGEGTDSKDWRSGQVCLATATHMSLTVPLEVNEAKGKRDAKL